MVTVPIDEWLLAPISLLLRPKVFVVQILTGNLFLNILLSNQIDCDYIHSLHSCNYIIRQYSKNVIIFRNFDWLFLMDWTNPVSMQSIKQYRTPIRVHRSPLRTMLKKTDCSLIRYIMVTSYCRIDKQCATVNISGSVRLPKGGYSLHVVAKDSDLSELPDGVNLAGEQYTNIGLGSSSKVALGFWCQETKSFYILLCNIHAKACQYYLQLECIGVHWE